MPRISRVGQHMYIVTLSAIGGIDKPNNAEALVHCLKQCGVTRFAFMKRDDAQTCIILTLPPTQCGTGEADEGRWMKRPFQKCDVAQHRQISLSLWIALNPSALIGNKDEGQIRPFRLSVKPIGQASQISGVQRFLGNQNETRTVIEIVRQTGERSPDIRLYSCIA